MPEIDKQNLYGRYMAQEDVDNALANAEKTWRDKLNRKMYHKALDIPDTDPTGDDLNVDNRKSTTVSGMDWKHLAIIAATGLGGMGLYRLGGNAQPATPPAAPPAVVSPSGQGSYKTEIEIRDAITHEPIKVDWIDADKPIAK
jgi:hypothetical protein